MDDIKQAEPKPGMGILWGAVHRKGDGTLISRQVNIEPPNPPDCIRVSCLIKFIWDTLRFTLIASYHARRVAYVSSRYYTVDEVGDKWRVRRAGLDPLTSNRYPYEKKVYDSFEVAQCHVKKIANQVLERYRTGEPTPQTMWQAIHANIKLTCPVCRKYNVDPLLRR